MTEDQAKELNQTLGYISGQLHGVALLLRIVADPVLRMPTAEASMVVQDALSFNPPELRNWRKALSPSHGWWTSSRQVHRFLGSVSV